jgi:hypothetical protein
MPVIFHHFIIHKKEMIDEYWKNRFRSTARTFAASSISPVCEALWWQS